MAFVSLIFPLASAEALPADTVDRCRTGLEEAGFKVEVLVVLTQGAPLPDELVDQHCLKGARWLAGWGNGLAASAITGLVTAEGDVRLVLDPTHGYLPEDLARVVEPVLTRKADLVVARFEPDGTPNGRLGPLRIASGWAGRIALKVLGASDPLAGLVAVSPGLVEQIAGTYAPVGSRFTIDLLLRSRGTKAEVPVRRERRPSPPGLAVDDLRHLKRLADDRFGNASRLLQFCAVGASGMVIDLSFYALFQRILRQSSLASFHSGLIGQLDLAVSGAIAIAIALSWNFMLNRRLTFSDARGGSIFRQYVAYAMSNALGIALSFSLRLLLPARFEFFDQHKLAAAVVGIVTATGLSFTLARWVVFRKRPEVVVAVESVPTPTGAPAASRS